MEKDFILTTLKKSGVMFGFTYFSIAIAQQSFTNLTPSLLATGMYFFAELARFYKVNSTNKTMRQQKKKLVTFTWLI